MSNKQQAIIYARVSSRMQEDNHSLPTQIAEMEKLCRAKGYQVVQVFRDVHTGAEFDQRDNLQDALDLIRKKQANVFVGYSVDRVARDQLHWNMIMYHVFKHAAKIELVEGPKIEDTPIGKFVAQAVAFTGESERAYIRERTMRGRRARVRDDGLPLVGRYPPYGYRWTDDPPRVLLLDEETAPVVRRIYEAVVAGMSLRAIAQMLTKEGILTPSDYQKKLKGELVERHGWSIATLGNILHFEGYTGAYYGFRWRVEKEEVIQPETGRVRTKHGRKNRLQDGPEVEDETKPILVKIPPIISEDLMREVAAILKRNRANSKRNLKDPNQAILRGHIFCGYCKSRMLVKQIAMSAHADGTPRFRVVYSCPRIHSQTDNAGIVCSPGASVAAGNINAWAWECVEELLTRPEILERYVVANRSAESVRKNLEANEHILKELIHQRDNVSLSIEQLEATENAMDAIVFLSKRVAAITQQIQYTEREQERYQRLLEDELLYEEKRRGFQSWVKHVRDTASLLAYEDKQTIFRVFNLRVYVWRKGHSPYCRLEVGRHQDTYRVQREERFPNARPTTTDVSGTFASDDQSGESPGNSTAGGREGGHLQQNSAVRVVPNTAASGYKPSHILLRGIPSWLVD